MNERTSSNPLAPVAKIIPCDKHKRSAAAFDAPWDSARLYENSGGSRGSLRARKDNSRKPTRDKLIIRPTAEDDEALYRASAVIRKFRQREQQRQIKLEPLTTPSCLKASGERKKQVFEKRVNFEKKSPGDYYDNEDVSLDEGSHSERQTARRNNDASLSNSSSCYYEPEQYCRIFQRQEDNKSRQAHENKCHFSPRRESETSGRLKRNFSSEMDHFMRKRGEYNSRSKKLQVSVSEASKGRSDDSLQLGDKMNLLSLTSSSSCSSPKIAKQPEIRIVKPKDSRRRAALKRMLVYPPEGQFGEPLTLRKKWSNIDCHVTGDPVKGFKYKVYYQQKFVSDKWFADEKTGGPFYQTEDANCSTTDYG